MEEEFLLAEQIKKKKQTVLLMLVTLLLAAAGAAVLLEPSTPASTGVARAETPPAPNQPATPIAETLVNTPTPVQTSTSPSVETATTTREVVSGEPEASGTNVVTTVVSTESTPLGSPSPADNADELNPPPITATIAATGPIQETPLPSNQTAGRTAENEGEAGTEVESTSENRDTTEASPSATIAPGAGTPMVRITPAASPGSGNNSANPATVATENSVTPQGNESANTSSNETPISIGDLPRVHELWESTGIETPANASGGATASITRTLVASETIAAIPPDGLPVTGIVTRRGMNWAALAIVVGLLIAGAIALIHPQSGRR